MTAKTMQGAVDRAIECVTRNHHDPTAPIEIAAMCAWAVGAAFRYMRDQPEPGETVAPVKDEEAERRSKLAFERQRAKAAGYTGHACGSCGNFTLVQNGTCLKCNTCGSTTGCS